jgi:hypothetical protein
MIVLRVTNQEFHTVLAALRYYQAHGQGDPSNRAEWVQDIASNGGAVASPLGDQAIDALCERLNLKRRRRGYTNP